MVCEIKFNDGSYRKILNVTNVVKYPKAALAEDDVFILTNNKVKGIRKEIALDSNNIKTIHVREAR